ncbi:hypothetical protein BY996DRAFT_6419727 [Phakopsora pachyrhizi]|nr:hypothetical protein BY996DRAFT_6419727 [Phakopsora pachyrhizi]
MPPSKSVVQTALSMWKEDNISLAGHLFEVLKAINNNNEQKQKQKQKQKSLKLSKPTGTSAKSKMNILFWFSSSLRKLREDQIKNISNSNLVDRGGVVKDQNDTIKQTNVLGGMKHVLRNVFLSEFDQVLFICVGDIGEQDLEMYCTEIGMRESVGNLELLIQIEKSVLELENKPKARPIAPPKPQHLCGTRTKEAPRSLPQAGPQPISVCSCLPVKSPVGQLDENGGENYFQRNTYHSTRKNNDSWSISETMITESNKLSCTSPQTVLPVDHKIN